MSFERLLSGPFFHWLRDRLSKLGHSRGCRGNPSLKLAETRPSRGMELLCVFTEPRVFDTCHTVVSTGTRRRDGGEQGDSPTPWVNSVEY